MKHGLLHGKNGTFNWTDGTLYKGEFQNNEIESQAESMKEAPRKTDFIINRQLNPDIPQTASGSQKMSPINKIQRGPDPKMAINVALVAQVDNVKNEHVPAPGQ